MELLHNTFMINIFLVALLGSLLTGVTGIFVELSGLGSIMAGIAHVLLAGVGIATYFQFSMFIGVFLCAIVSSAVFAYYYVYRPSALSTLSNVLWGGGMAIGVLFMSLTPGYQQGLSSFLFGNLALVSEHDVQILFGMFLLTIILLVVFWRQIVLVIFSRTLANLQGVHVFFVMFLMITLLSFTVLSLLKTVGISLALVLMVMPMSIGKRFFKNLIGIMVFASCISFASMSTGVVLSYYYNLPIGPIVVILIIGLFVLSLAKKPEN